MSIRNNGASTATNNVGLSNKFLGKSAKIPAISTWVRNPSWPACAAASGSNKIVGLYAVWPGDGTGNGGNFFAMTVAGAYTINYGDGTTTNYATGVTAYYEFNYNNANLANTNAPVTFTDAGDLVTRTSHGYSNGMIVRFYSIVSTTGISEAQPYYVINATTNTFQISATLGGSAVALTTNGSGALLPYKIATVTITPQAANNLTSVNFFVKHNQTNLQAYSVGWLDIAIAAPSCTTLNIGGVTTLNVAYLEKVSINQLGGILSFASLFANCYSLESVYIDTSISSVTNMSSMFSGCYSLTTVPLFNTAAVTNMSSMFSACRNLTTVPLFNTAAVTNMSSMFSGCYSLTTVPLLNTAIVTTMQGMFSGCYSLTTVPLFNTVAVNTMLQMFLDCYSLINVPLFNTVAVTNMGQMFQNCYSLTSVPLFNTAAVGDMNSMFRSCYSLTSVPLFNTAIVTTTQNMFLNCNNLTTVPLFNTVTVNTTQSMFANCVSLTTVPLFNTAAVTNMTSMFLNCYSLTTVPLFNTAAVTNMNELFANCFNLTSVPALVTTAVTSSTNFVNMFGECYSLARIRAKNFRFTFSVANCKLSATALNEIYTNLPTASGQTITVTGNYGTATDTITTATAKGWTVSG
jgi:surface protein